MVHLAHEGGLTLDKGWNDTPPMPRNIANIAEIVHWLGRERCPMILHRIVRKN